MTIEILQEIRDDLEGKLSEVIKIVKESKPTEEGFLKSLEQFNAVINLISNINMTIIQQKEIDERFKTKEEDNGSNN